VTVSTTLNSCPALVLNADFRPLNYFPLSLWSWQDCDGIFPTNILTFDHVVPRSRGGRTEWTNVVAACSNCNLKKANKLLHEAGMKIRRKPVQPSNYQLQKIGKGFPPNYLHESWRDFLYWDAELDPI
jgi:5-methylcytosine-specific restriction endonuclease McrA